MVNNAALGLVNHLLTGEDWARERLLEFSGQTARLLFGRSVLSFTISDAGLLGAADTAAAVAVSIRLPDDAPVRALTDRASLFSTATISGSADLAETLAFVFRNLRWDVEHDLSRLLGDMVARRALQLANGLAQWQAGAARNLAFSLAEYLTEEEAAIASRPAVQSFCVQVDALRDDLARFEKRLERFALRQG